MLDNISEQPTVESIKEQKDALAEAIEALKDSFVEYSIWQSRMPGREHQKMMTMYYSGSDETLFTNYPTFHDLATATLKIAKDRNRVIQFMIPDPQTGEKHKCTLATVHPTELYFSVEIRHKAKVLSIESMAVERKQSAQHVETSTAGSNIKRNLAF